MKRIIILAFLMGLWYNVSLGDTFKEARIETINGLAYWCYVYYDDSMTCERLYVTK